MVENIEELRAILPISGHRCKVKFEGPRHARERQRSTHESKGKEAERVS